MKAIIYRVISENDVKMGEYKPTELDKAKEKADFLLQAIDGCWYTIYMKRPLPLPKGSEVYSNGLACIHGERTFKAFAKKYNWECDF